MDPLRSTELFRVPLKPLLADAKARLRARLEWEAKMSMTAMTSLLGLVAIVVGVYVYLNPDPEPGRFTPEQIREFGLAAKNPPPMHQDPELEAELQSLEHTLSLVPGKAPSRPIGGTP